MTYRTMVQSILYGMLASGILLFIYFVVVSVISGAAFARTQFSQFWYFLISLSIGFGIQIGLYMYLTRIIRQNIHPSSRSTQVVAVTGTTSTVAMVSCCAHYLVNILPILGITGILTVVSQYQIQLFWVGILSNGLGIVYMVNRIRKVART